MMKKRISVSVVVLMLVTLGVVLAGESAKLLVTVQGYDTREGSIRMAVFNSEKEFPRGARFAEGRIDLTTIASNDLAQYTFNLSTGQYAVAVIHDKNDNGQMDMSFFYVPLEKYGFSRNPGFTFGAPAFEKVAFELPAEGTGIVINLK